MWWMLQAPAGGSSFFRGMRVRLSVLMTVTAVALLMAASAAQASCENRAFIGFGPGNQPSGPGVDPDAGVAEPGGTVAVHGQRFEPGSIARVRMGISGPVLGEAMADETGSWVV